MYVCTYIDTYALDARHSHSVLQANWYYSEKNKDLTSGKTSSG